MTTRNNNLLYNAAVGGTLAGATAGVKPISAVAGSYATLAANVAAVAQEVDSQIANDSTISGANGVTLAPSTAAIASAQAAKTALLAGICEGVFQGAPPLDAGGSNVAGTPGTYAALAANIAALYTEQVTQLTIG
jgi:hypothetical protein